MAHILLIETATEVCSVAIAVDGRVVAHVEEPHATSHTSLLTLQIAACTRQAGCSLADLDAVALSSGPGSYTSLRVGASVAKGICFALDKPLIAVDTLQALAWAMQQQYGPEWPNEPLLLVPALDARRQEIWTAVYNRELQLLMPAQPLILENDLFENLLLKSGGDRSIIGGNGSEKIRTGLNCQVPVFFTKIRCSALHMVGLATLFFQSADFQNVAYFEPFYMKPPNITTPNNISF